MTTDRGHRAGGIRSASLWVVAICWVTVVFDGYDLIVYGAVVPSLLGYGAWDLTPQEVGVIGALALMGMLIGALIAGAITDIVGRRRTILVSISWSSIAMGLCAIAPSPELFALFRFVAGLGLGGVLPTAIALTIEYAPVHRRNLYNALMMSGYVIGGVLSSILGILLIPDFGWRVMFWIGLAPLALVLPIAYRFLPESMEFLYAKGRKEEAEEYARRFDVPLQVAAESAQKAVGEEVSNQGSKLTTLASLFSRNYLAATVLFWIASFCSLLLIYGMYTWLPQIMSEAGYPLGSAITFLLVSNVGAVLGSILVSVFADRFGSKPVTAVAFLAAMFAILLMSFRLPTVALYTLAALAGVGIVGAQMLVNAYVAGHYPVGSRATALGWSLGLGRLGGIFGPVLGGMIVGSQLGLNWNFYAFAVFALLGALVALAVPRSPLQTTTTATVDTRAESPVR